MRFCVLYPLRPAGAQSITILSQAFHWFSMSFTHMNSKICIGSSGKFTLLALQRICILQIVIINSMATELGLPWWVRGPPGPELNGPVYWKTIPWNSTTQHWTWTRALVRTLLTEYDWDDWNAPESLAEEHALAVMHNLPWNVRGPNGPKEGGPEIWRGMTYREGVDKWMRRGSQKPKKSSEQ